MRNNILSILSFLFIISTSFSCGQKTDPVDEDDQELSSGEGVVRDEEIGEPTLDGIDDFVQTATSSSMAQVEMAQIAVKKAQKPELREFAQMVMDDHSSVSEKLKKISRQMSIEPQLVLLPRHQDEMSKLDTTSVTEFDAGYLQAVLNLQQQIIDNFNDYQDDANTEELQDFINNTLPKLRSHRDRAEEISEDLQANPVQEGDGNY